MHLLSFIWIIYSIDYHPLGSNRDPSTILLKKDSLSFPNLRVLVCCWFELFPKCQISEIFGILWHTPLGVWILGCFEPIPILRVTNSFPIGGLHKFHRQNLSSAEPVSIPSETVTPSLQHAFGPTCIILTSPSLPWIDPGVKHLSLLGLFPLIEGRFSSVVLVLSYPFLMFC